MLVSPLSESQITMEFLEQDRLFHTGPVQGFSQDQLRSCRLSSSAGLWDLHLSFLSCLPFPNALSCFSYCFWLADSFFIIKDLNQYPNS
jgi:hypothetical protein